MGGELRLGALGPAPSLEERAELLGLGQRHMCRELTGNPQARHCSPERLGLAGRPRKGRRDKRFDKKAGLTLIPVPPLESLCVKQATLSACSSGTVPS